MKKAPAGAFDCCLGGSGGSTLPRPIVGLTVLDISVGTVGRTIIRPSGETDRHRTLGGTSGKSRRQTSSLSGDRTASPTLGTDEMTTTITGFVGGDDVIGDAEKIPLGIIVIGHLGINAHDHDIVTNVKGGSGSGELHFRFPSLVGRVYAKP